MPYRTLEEETQRQRLLKAGGIVAFNALVNTGMSFSFETVTAEIKRLCNGNEELETAAIVVLTATLMQATKKQP